MLRKSIGQLLLLLLLLLSSSLILNFLLQYTWLSIEIFHFPLNNYTNNIKKDLDICRNLEEKDVNSSFVTQFQWLKSNEQIYTLKGRLSLIVQVNVVLNRTVVVESDWRFVNLCAVVIFRVKV